MNDLTSITVFADGRTEPHIPFGTVILMIQDGNVSVGKIQHEEGDKSSVYIEHPKNEMDVNVHALKIIKELKPESLASKTALIVTCPSRLIKDIIW